jgi:hypothetical protein
LLAKVEFLIIKNQAALSTTDNPMHLPLSYCHPLGKSNTTLFRKVQSLQSHSHLQYTSGELSRIALSLTVPQGFSWFASS